MLVIRPRRKIMLVLVAFCTGALLFAVCIGFDQSSFSCKITGAKQQRRCYYFPFWRNPSRALKIYEKEKKLPSAIESFLSRFSNQRNDSCKNDWHRDATIRHTLWGADFSVTPKTPGLYQPFDSFGNEALLYDFLALQQKANTNLADEVQMFLRDPMANWTIKWRKTNQVAYYQYYLDVYLQKPHLK